MAGGLVFTGMPRRREVLGTGIIRWTKVVNPDGSVTWQEDQPTESVNSKKEEKGTKTDKQTLERPSWIDVKKESNVRVNKRLAHEVEDLEQKQAKVEARPTRAFSFRTEEKKTERAEKTTNVEEVRFDASVRDDKKKGFVAGLASKLDRTAEESVCPKKETKKEKVETQPAHPFNPPPKEEENANAEPLRSHWSKQEDDNKQESDAELAQRLANTEKIFRQQEQKIQAALDRIRDLEKQLASGFANSTSTESDEVQSKTTWDNESIAAGGRESGPHFRQSKSSDDEPMSRISAKGPLPCLSDHEPHNYRVLTVNSNKPEVCAGSYHEPKVGSTCELDGTRTPSPIAVTINIPPARQNPEPHTKPHHHHLQLPPIRSRSQPLPQTKARSPLCIQLQKTAENRTPTHPDPRGAIVLAKTQTEGAEDEEVEVE
ncbi:hypothetical protein B0H65DRAFT_446828 [Neurospora tetraspora]|uniref:Uncharacterized protein n=1 Tax=Neurospora tetraspora TaxID=94610 RepID=A0AAE0J071_9PEZI|nr:hypothetical protein B0H65DRAFT_446828 [Neurospora tetraspora]